MSYWGTQGPSIKLLDNGGLQVEAIELPRPTERLKEDWIPEIENFGQTMSHSEVKIRRGFRFVARYLWKGLRPTDSASIGKLIKVINWRDGKLRLWPYKDGTARMLVRVEEVSREFTMKSVKYDDITVEFRGIDLLSHIPDPVMDRVLRPYRRGHVMIRELPIS